MKPLFGALVLSACAAGQIPAPPAANSCPPPVTMEEISPPAVIALGEYRKIERQSIDAIKKAESPDYVRIIQEKRNTVADRLEDLVKQDGHPTKSAINAFYAASRAAVTALKTTPINIGIENRTRQ